MFGSNDKNQPNNTQLSDTTVMPPATLPQGPFVSAQPDPVITPTAPPLSDTLAAPTGEPQLPPPEPIPTIIPDNTQKKPSDTAMADVSPAPLNADEGDLLNIKQQALQNLTPLVDHLDQSPEEKFKTTMMLIQASDNAALIKDAYAAANSITDEKNRARALLDVVNEINYFTQHQNHEQN